MNIEAYLLLITVAIFLFNYILYRIALGKIRKQAVNPSGTSRKDFERKIEARIAGKLMRPTR